VILACLTLMHSQLASAYYFAPAGTASLLKKLPPNPRTDAVIHGRRPESGCCRRQIEASIRHKAKRHEGKQNPKSIPNPSIYRSSSPATSPILTPRGTAAGGVGERALGRHRRLSRGAVDGERKGKESSKTRSERKEELTVSSASLLLLRPPPPRSRGIRPSIRAWFRSSERLGSVWSGNEMV
jgi:hypothetical protein